MVTRQLGLTCTGGFPTGLSSARSLSRDDVSYEAKRGTEHEKERGHDSQRRLDVTGKALMRDRAMRILTWRGTSA